MWDYVRIRKQHDFEIFTIKFCETLIAYISQTKIGTDFSRGVLKSSDDFLSNALVRFDRICKQYRVI